MARKNQQDRRFYINEVGRDFKAAVTIINALKKQTDAIEEWIRKVDPNDPR